MVFLKQETLNSDNVTWSSVSSRVSSLEYTVCSPVLGVLEMCMRRALGSTVRRARQHSCKVRRCCGNDTVPRLRSKSANDVPYAMNCVMYVKAFTSQP
jgi:hypothetical protein